MTIVNDSSGANGSGGDLYASNLPMHTFGRSSSSTSAASVMSSSGTKVDLLKNNFRQFLNAIGAAAGGDGDDESDANRRGPDETAQGTSNGAWIVEPHYDHHAASTASQTTTLKSYFWTKTKLFHESWLMWWSMDRRQYRSLILGAFSKVVFKEFRGQFMREWMETNELGDVEEMFQQFVREQEEEQQQNLANPGPGLVNQQQRMQQQDPNFENEALLTQYRRAFCCFCFHIFQSLRNKITMAFVNFAIFHFRTIMDDFVVHRVNHYTPKFCCLLNTVMIFELHLFEKICTFFFWRQHFNPLGKHSVLFGCVEINPVDIFGYIIIVVTWKCKTVYTNLLWSCTSSRYEPAWLFCFVL